MACSCSNLKDKEIINMSFWEQFAIIQAQAAIHVLIMRYAKEYFTAEEQQALTIIAAALIELPERIHTAPAPPAPDITHHLPY